MDALQLVLALLIGVSEPCTPMPARDVANEAGQFRVERLVCGQTTLELWSRGCILSAPERSVRKATTKASPAYYSRPFLLVEVNTGKGIYMNEFGEMVVGWHVDFDTVYFPSCES